MTPEECEQANLEKEVHEVQSLCLELYKQCHGRGANSAATTTSDRTSMQTDREFIGEGSKLAYFLRR